MAEVVWLAEATADLEAIRSFGRLPAGTCPRFARNGSFVEQSSPRRAERLVRRLIAAVERLRAFPLSGRPRPEEPFVRDLVVPPFRIEHLVLGDRVVIVAIKHGARSDAPETVHEAPAAYGT